MSNFQKIKVQDEPRVELHDLLGLTGAEVSINKMPAGVSVPFVHSHKQNEEIYGILSGKGSMMIDGEIVKLEAGDWLRVSPSAKRQLSADNECEISYICIQVKEGSLQQMTASDAII